MKLPPMWKIKRELARVFRTIGAFPRFATSYLFATPFYDLHQSKKSKTWSGKQTLSDRIVILVIYPSEGLLESHITTLNHIADSGYTALVISNQPLSDVDRKRVLDLSATYIERPNIGYDFGAYRDGILSVAHRFDQLDRLVLMNDSVWYPLPEQRNWLQEAEGMGLDLVGAVSNYGTPRVESEDYLSLVWGYKSTHHNFHYGSFALSFGPNIFQNTGFYHFWKKMRIDNHKKHVVRRGEIGISQWVLSNGFTHGSIYNPSTLEVDLAALSDQRLAQVAVNLIIPEKPRALALKHQILQLPQSDLSWRHEVTQFILTVTSLQGCGYVLPDLMIKEHGYPFLKKSPLRLSKDGAEVTLRLIDELPDHLNSVFLHEARAIYDSHTHKNPLETET